jgi:hypothetical protein
MADSQTALVKRPHAFPFKTLDFSHFWFSRDFSRNLYLFLTAEKVSDLVHNAFPSAPGKTSRGSIGGTGLTAA